MFRSSMGSQLLISFAAGLFITRPSLNYPWYGEDLHGADRDDVRQGT